MAGKDLILDGKTKRILSTDNADQVIIEFKDDESQFDGEVKAKFKQKGELRNEFSVTIYELLEGYHIPTHFYYKVDEVRQRVKKLNMIPLSVTVRNIAAGSLCHRFKIKEGTVLKYPVLEYYLKNRELDNPMILESHAYAFDCATPDEMKHIARLASKINAVLKSYFERRFLKLVDYQLQFGRYQRQVYLGDEISPDNCRLWDVREDSTLDKSRFSYEDGMAEKSYREILNRLAGR